MWGTITEGIILTLIPTIRDRDNIQTFRGVIKQHRVPIIQTGPSIHQGLLNRDNELKLNLKPNQQETSMSNESMLKAFISKLDNHIQNQCVSLQN